MRKVPNNARSSGTPVYLHGVMLGGNFTIFNFNFKDRTMNNSTHFMYNYRGIMRKFLVRMSVSSLMNISLSIKACIFKINYLDNLQI
jgi:hypothetical protein